MDILWAQLLLQFDTDSFETSQVFWSWSEDMHVVWIILRLLLLLFLQVELSHFWALSITVSEWIVDTLWTQLLLQFYTDSFETSPVFLSWSEDTHVVCI